MTVQLREAGSSLISPIPVGVIGRVGSPIPAEDDRQGMRPGRMGCVRGARRSAAAGLVQRELEWWLHCTHSAQTPLTTRLRLQLHD
jgi:hypothetical protein